MNEVILYFKKIYSGSKQALMKDILSCLKKKKKKFIITVNTEIIVSADKQESLSTMLLDDNLTLICDGTRVCMVAQKHLKKKMEIIPGVDITKELLKIAHENKYSMYIYGSSKETITLLKEKIDKEYFNINLLGLKDGYSYNHDVIMAEIISLKPDIAIVALGVPTQEKLIYDSINKVNKGIYIGVGGSLDVISGMKKRAPKIMIKLHLEWLYRIIKEPKRLSKFIKNNIQFSKMLRRSDYND